MFTGHRSDTPRCQAIRSPVLEWNVDDSEDLDTTRGRRRGIRTRKAHPVDTSRAVTEVIPGRHLRGRAGRPSVELEAWGRARLRLWT